jgi:hypothetical protein
MDGSKALDDMQDLVDYYDGVHSAMLGKDFAAIDALMTNLEFDEMSPTQITYWFRYCFPMKDRLPNYRWSLGKAVLSLKNRGIDTRWLFAGLPVPTIIKVWFRHG